MGNGQSFRMRHLNKSGKWPSGNPRMYYRPKGARGVALPDYPIDSPEFRKAYAEAELSRLTHAKPGTIEAAIEMFQTSREFASKSAGTRRVWARTFDAIRKKYGQFYYGKIRAKHIKSDLTEFNPHPANNRLKAWKALFRWLDETGKIEIDPIRQVRKRKTPKTSGYIPWTREDFETCRTHWGIDTRERLAFELYYRTCAATIDATSLSLGHVSGGWLTYERSKSGGIAAIPWSAEIAPEWFEWRDDLEQCLSVQPKQMTFIITAHGKPRSEKAASQWFSKACNEAGLPALSAHGIRKGRAAIFKENGATQEQRMAILGHETEAEASHYSKSADLKQVVTGTKVPTPSSNLVQLSNKNNTL